MVLKYVRAGDRITEGLKAKSHSLSCLPPRGVTYINKVRWKDRKPGRPHENCVSYAFFTINPIFRERYALILRKAGGKTEG